MVDIHSHILYGLDDGPRTIDQSLAMLDMARDAGTTDIVATPHANARYVFDHELIDARLAELGARVEIRIHRGCDLHLHVEGITAALERPSRYTINGKGYLLVELPETAVIGSITGILERLLEGGMTPVITHPERHAQLQRVPAVLSEWVARGCYVQVTASSFTGRFGRRAQASANELLRRGLTHFVASDGHDCKMRPPALREAFDLLSRTWGEERIRPMFVENPRSTLTGDPIQFDPGPWTAKARKWYQFW